MSNLTSYPSYKRKHIVVLCRMSVRIQWDGSRVENIKNKYTKYNFLIFPESAYLLSVSINSNLTVCSLHLSVYDMEVAQQQMMEVAAHICREQVSEAVQQLQAQLSEATVSHAALEQRETEIKALLEDKLNELERLKSASPSGHPEPDESQADTLNELRVRVDALCNMIDDIDEKVQTTLLDDADWMQLRICELEASVGIVCDRDARSLLRSTTNIEENYPDDHPYNIQELQDKMKVLAERVSHLARIPGFAESGEESEDDDD